MNACRLTPPAKYARKGAVLRSDYAYPQCWKYPIDTPEHTRAAASYFARFGHRIPPPERKRVAARIEQAKRRFGIGPYRDNPREAKTMSAAKEAKIRGHRLALANAINRGDQKAAKEQRAALRALGASGSVKSNPSRSKGRVRVVSGYRKNPDEKPAKKATSKRGRVKPSVAEQIPRRKPSGKKASKRGRVKPSVAEQIPRNEPRAAEAPKAAAEASKPRKPATRRSSGRSKTMKRTKAERSAAAKKGAATKKRNARKAAGKKSGGSKRGGGKPAYGTPAWYRYIGKKGAAARKRKGGGAKASSKGKGGGREGKRHNRGFGLPKGFKKIDTKQITRGRSKKTGEVRTIVKYRRYKDNPLSDVSKIAMWGGGVVLGLVLSDMLRRFVATMAPKGGKKPFYGTPASERTTFAAPDAMQLGAQLGLGAILGGGAFLLRKKSPGATALLAGAAVGAVGLAILEGVNWYLMPKILPAANISEEKPGNRLYVTEQKYAQDQVTTDIKAQNAAIEAGKTVNPDGGNVSGARGLAGAPSHRALPPPARANAVAGAPGRQGTLAGAPSNSVGCGGMGGCGGGCSGGRNCGCSKCSGMSEALLPQGGSTLETFPNGGSFQNPPPARGGETVATSAPSRTVSGPRQLGSPKVPSLFPSRAAAPRPRMALAR